MSYLYNILLPIMPYQLVGEPLMIVTGITCVLLLSYIIYGIFWLLGRFF